MAYSQRADLNLSTERLVELTDSADAVGVVDEDLLDRLHVRATNKVNAAIYGKYTVDPDDVSEILVELQASLWRYYLYAHREVMEVPGTVREDYQAALAQLEKYRTGMEALDAGHTNAATDPVPTSGSFSSDSDDRVFGRAKDGIF